MMRSLKLVCLFLCLAGAAQAQQNGITVGQPKAYDNRSLTIMLDQLNMRLQQLQIVDQASLAKALGTFQGSQVTDQSFSFSAAVAPPMAPGSGTGGSQGSSSSGSTGSGSSGSSGSGSSGSGSSGTGSSNSGNSGSGSGSQSKSSGSSSSGGSATTPSLPDLIAPPGFTPQFNESAGDLLSDQIDLTYQIFNLRMLLERSLTDRLLSNGHTRRQAVLSFNITIDPPKDARDAAAYVEITISNPQGPLSLVAAMPQEKTYNTTALSTSSTAFSGSAVAKIITVGVNFRRRAQTFFLYRDSDTLALEHPQTAENALTFGWVFRPVLGRHSVSPGMRQLFVVVSLPDDDEPQTTAPTNLTATATTYWRHYDKKSLTTVTRAGFWDWSSKRLPRPENIGLSTIGVPSTSVMQADLAPHVQSVHWAPTSKGTSTIEIDGKNFFIGTTVTLGNKLLTTPQDGLFIKSDQTLVITASDDVVNSAFSAFVNGRYGGTVPLFTPPAQGIFIQAVTTVPRGLGYSDLRVILSSFDDSPLRTNDIVGYPTPVLILNGTLVQISPALHTQFRSPAWRPSASYRVGEMVIPPFGNGHSYICVTAGASGANPPVWSTSTGGTFADGTVLWQEYTKSDLIVSYRVANSLLKGRDNQLTIAFPLLGKNWSADTVTYDDKAVVLAKLGGNDQASTTLMLSRPGVEMSGNWKIVLDKTYVVDAAPNTPPAKVTLSRPVPCKVNPSDPGCYVIQVIADSKLLKDFKKMLLVDPEGFAQVVDLSPPPLPPDPPKIAGATSDAVKEGETPTVAFKGSGLRGIRQVSFQGKQLPFSVNDEGTQLQVLLSRDVTGKQGHQELQLDTGKSLLTGTVNVAPAPKSATSTSSDKKGQDSNE